MQNNVASGGADNQSSISAIKVFFVTFFVATILGLFIFGAAIGAGSYGEGIIATLIIAPTIGFGLAMIASVSTVMAKISVILQSGNRSHSSQPNVHVRATLIAICILPLVLTGFGLYFHHQANKVKIADLYHAISDDDTELALSLIDGKEFTINELSTGHSPYFTPLICAAQYGRLEVFNALIEKGVTVDHQLALKMLIKGSKSADTIVMIKALEKEGGSLSGRSGMDRPIQTAAKVGDLEVIKYVVEKDMEFNSRDYFMGNSPLYLASKNEHKSVVQYLNTFKFDFSSDELRMASRDGYIMFIEAYVNQGGNVDIELKHGKRMLHYACLRPSRHWWETCKYLLSVGADVNAADESGLTPLMYALTEWSKPGPKDWYLNEMLSYGVDLKIRDESGRTLMNLADERGMESIASFLEAKIENIN